MYTQTLSDGKKSDCIIIIFNNSKKDPKNHHWTFFGIVFERLQVQLEEAKIIK